MAVNHRILSLAFAFAVGLFVSFCSYQWISNPDRGAQRAVEEGVVRESRRILETWVAEGNTIEISDPLNRVRSAGKVYIYPVADGWELSGQYRLSGENRWHPYLMTLDADARLVSLSVEDSRPSLREKAGNDPRFTVQADN
jgi:hypothetical protein